MRFFIRNTQLWNRWLNKALIPTMRVYQIYHSYFLKIPMHLPVCSPAKCSGQFTVYMAQSDHHRRCSPWLTVQHPNSFFPQKTTSLLSLYMGHAVMINTIFVLGTCSAFPHLISRALEGFTRVSRAFSLDIKKHIDHITGWDGVFDSRCLFYLYMILCCVAFWLR